MDFKTQKRLGKIFVYTDLLIQEIDDKDKVPTKETKAIQDKCNELLELLEPVLDRFYDNDSVRKTNIFITIQRKINYIFDKEYK